MPKNEIHGSYSNSVFSFSKDLHTVLLGFPGSSDGRESAVQDTWVWSLGWEDPLEKGMTTHSSILVWRIPWTEDLDRLQSTGWEKARHSWVTNTFILFSIVAVSIYILGALIYWLSVLFLLTYSTFVYVGGNSLLSEMMVYKYPLPPVCWLLNLLKIFFVCRRVLFLCNLIKLLWFLHSVSYFKRYFPFQNNFLKDLLCFSIYHFIFYIKVINLAEIHIST